MSHKLLYPALFAALLASAPLAHAVPYASGIRNTTGSTYEFVLNEAADSVTIKRNGLSDVVINSPAAGRHQFDLGGASSYDIEVRNAAPTEWTFISDRLNPWTKYNRPSGLAVNTDPSSAYFGTVYVSNNNDLDVVVSETVTRSMGDGIYAISADRIGVDLSNYTQLADPNDTSQAKVPPGATFAGSSNSPWKFTMDASNNLIITDWSDANGGLKWASPDLQSGGLILAGEGGPEGGIPSSVSDSAGDFAAHGSIVSAFTKGSVNSDLQVWTLDEDLGRDLFPNSPTPAGDGNHLWYYNVQNATNYDLPPELRTQPGTYAPIVDNGDYAAVGGADYTQIWGGHSDIFYSEATGKWYKTQARSDGLQPGLIVFSLDENNDDALTTEWSSLEFSTTNNLDGFTDDPEVSVSLGIQDIFRQSASVIVSPDGSMLYLTRRQVMSSAFPNPITGMDSILPGRVLGIPLDENGLPDIEFSDNGTPGDLTDDFLTNVVSLFEDDTASGLANGYAVKMDAAGNLYFSSNISETLEVMSPGGNTLAITSSAGTFSVEEYIPPAGIPGDYNDDGTVDAADYVVWRNSLGSTDALPFNDATPGVDISDYTVWKNNFGMSSLGSLAGVSQVPEPTSVAGLLLMVGLGALVRKRLA